MCSSSFTSYGGRKKKFHFLFVPKFFFKFSSSSDLCSSKPFLLSEIQEGLEAEWSPGKKKKYKTQLKVCWII